MFAVVGSGPGAVAARDGLAGRDHEISTNLDAVERATLAVVVGPTGDERFRQADARARAGDTPWFAVEFGGLGGVPAVDAAVTGLAPDRGCYDCLRTRARANWTDGQSPTGTDGQSPTGTDGQSPTGTDDQPATGTDDQPATGTDDQPATGTDDQSVAGDVGPSTRRLAGAVAGHEAVRAATGEDPFGRVVVVPYAEHPFLPAPGCDCGSRPTGSVPRTWVDRSVEASLERAERALDALVGPVQEVGEAESFPLPYYLATLCDTAGFSDATAPRNAAGADPDWNRAFVKALGEALERYCAGVYRSEDLDRRRPTALGNAVAPSAFVCKQSPENEPIRWVPGTALGSDETVALPAAFVYHPPPTERYRPAVTTGLGFGNSGVEALLSGLYEVIERDAAMLAWYSTFEPLELTTDAVERTRSRAAAEGLDVTLLLLTMDVDVPVVAAAVHRESWPRLALGTAANLDAGAAASSALAEALQNWMELRGMGPDRATEATGAIGRYADSPGDAAAFLDADRTIAAGDISEAVDGTAELDAVLERLRAAGLDGYAARTTTRDVESLGFEAVRVLVPGAQPLTFGDPFFGERARRVPRSMGFEPRLDRAHHPFP